LPANENSKALSVYAFTINRAAVMAPKKPPIYEKTDDIFCTSLLIAREDEDLNITILTYTIFFGSIEYARLTTEPSRIDPLSSYSLTKGQKL